MAGISGISGAPSLSVYGQRVIDYCQ